MKRSPPPTDADDDGQTRGPPSQRRRVDPARPLTNMGDAVADLVAAWTRAHAGRGSPQDVALWRRYATVNPAEPWGLATDAARRGLQPVDTVLGTYEPLWRRLERRPTLMRHLADLVQAGPTPLPSLVDLIDAAYRLATDDTRPSLARTVRDLGSPDAYVRRDAVDDLVDFVDVALRRRDALERLGRGPISPDYPAALPPDAWDAAVGTLARMTSSYVPFDDAPAQADRTESAARACDPDVAYYLLVARVGAHPEGAHDGLPDQGTYVFLMEPSPVEGRRGRARSVAIYASDMPPFVDVQRYLDSRVLVPEEDTMLLLFLAAVGGAMPYGPLLGEDAAGAAQVRAALVPLHSLAAMPDAVDRTFEAIDAHDRGWHVAPLDALSAVWITECQLEAAVRAFAGQMAARRAGPLFHGGVPTLFDAVGDAIAVGSHAVDIGPGTLPREVLERILPRVWQRVCSAAASPSGTLRGAPNLATVARALGLDVDWAASTRPELLCDALASGAVAAQTAQWRQM
ncbi:hypothetical protein pdul_cds_485 [Pandoravirus dulcis]|uniref:DUF5848 domain-containing protein n=1 Tax=Pandoravirus dulcis TaxID=1349409 RepID=S4VT39_9VIRU|nr:hypothetical protein pdul_cds_485 [Pandoravirus dulcis]AGO82565.1 hypothetical protein pdul_cds_485 [Pandoravirus dulcis]